MRILLIGGTSLVGPHLVRELLNIEGNRVWTLTRSGKPYFCEQALQGNRRDAAALKSALKAARPDAIVDMIPFTTEDATVLAEAITAIDDPPNLIAISSIDVYRAFGRLHDTEMAPFQDCPISEEMELRAKLGPEGAAYDKISVERICREAMTNLTILRLPAIYGWPDTTRVLPYLDQMLDGAATIEIPQDRAEFRFSRCLHKNAAHAVSLAVTACEKAHHTYNVAEPVAFSEQEWIEKIADCCGWTGRIAVMPWSKDAEKPRQQFEVSSELIRAELGYREKYDVEEGLADTVAFHAYQRLGKTYEKYY